MRPEKRPVLFRPRTDPPGGKRWIQHGDLAARCARSDAICVCPRESGGRRESRVPMTPAVVRKNAHGGPQVRRNTRPSLRSGFTAYAVISPEPNSSGLRRRRIGDRSKARSGPTISISLTPATGARTTRFCRPQLPQVLRSNRPACCRKKFRPRRLSAVRLAQVARSRNNALRTHLAPDAAASTATRPNVRDVGQRPSSRDRMAGVVGVIWGVALSKKFGAGAK